MNDLSKPGDAMGPCESRRGDGSLCGGAVVVDRVDLNGDYASIYGTCARCGWMWQTIQKPPTRIDLLLEQLRGDWEILPPRPGLAMWRIRWPNLTTIDEADAFAGAVRDVHRLHGLPVCQQGTRDMALVEVMWVDADEARVAVAARLIDDTYRATLEELRRHP